MNNKHQQYYTQIKSLVLSHLTPVLLAKLEGQMQLIAEAKLSLNEYYSSLAQDESKVEALDTVRKMKTLKETWAKSINELSSTNTISQLDNDFSTYFSELEAYAEALPESLLEDQNPDRFQPFPQDSFKIKIGKKLKKWGLQIGWIPDRIANWFRKTRGKPAEPLKLWKHQIPLRGLIIYHFRDLLVEQLIEMMQAIYRTIAVSTHELYLIETSLDQKFANTIGADPSESIPQPEINENAVDNILVKIKELSESVEGMTSNRLERIYGMFQLNYEMVGTIELSVKNFEANGLATAHKQASRAYDKTMSGWRNTLAVLSDRYNFDHELFKTRYTNLEQYLFVSQKVETRISDKILNEIYTIAGFLEERQQQLESATASEADFKKLLKEIRYETLRYLRQTVPESIHLIREQNLPGLLDNLEAKIKSEIAQLSETRSMVKNISYEHAIKDSEINKIAPKELITFEALPEYLNTIESLKGELNSLVESTQQQLMEISNICDFNLETALAAIDEEAQHDKAKAMSVEGIERAHSRLQDIVAGLEGMAKNVDKVVHQAVVDFNQRVMAMNEIDQVFDTQVRIAKAKAVEKTRALRAQFVYRFKKFFPRLITNLKRRGLMVYKQYRDTSQKYGIANPVQELNAEISGFLADTEKTVNNLPFVYQRLFEIAPLDNLYFFEPRPLGSLSLKKAFENWESGHFGATALIAEAGSGVTSLIYFFLKELKSNLPVVYLETDQQIHAKNDLFSLLNETLKTTDINSTDSLVNHLNQLEGRRIIVLEDLEHFFLRTINGFECIKIIIETVTRTNQNVFWLVSVNKYSYNFLSKTIGIDQYFSYNIQLRPLKPSQVTSLILKRHRVSGFSIVFKPSKLDRKNKKFQKMDESEKQEYLRKEYFNALNRIVQSNIEVALVYWLRSIIEINEDVMYIRSLKGVDFSFLMKLSEEKLYTLQSMLLHHGISVADHAKIFQLTVKDSKFSVLPLFDDGIIVHKTGEFYLNPLLFRAVVNLLRDKNILH